ncbi:MAG TPA: hypothetical protein VFB74_22480 [Kribbellaceae bacterium]|nr:hypothetical protein [Kribbellaceae bacterium]
MAKRPVTVNDLLDGQVALDLDCPDRVYLNGYVPNLQGAGQFVIFLTRHLGYPIPSPALMDQIGQRFRRAVDSYARANHIPVVRFTKGQRKIDVMRRYLNVAAASGRSQVAAIGWAQEYAQVAAARTWHTATGCRSSPSARPSVGSRVCTSTCGTSRWVRRSSRSPRISRIR